MKILESHPIPPPVIPEWVGKVMDCGECKTKFELEFGDAIEQPSGCSSKLLGIYCPTCGGRILFYP